MKTILKTITTLSLPLLISSNLLADDIKLDSLGLNIGSSYTNVKQVDISGSLTLDNNPNTSFTSYELYANIDKLLPLNLKTYTSITYSNNNELEHKYVLVGASKYYKLNNISLYSSLLLGHGELRYKYNPVNSKDNDITATSFIAGIQLGANYPISNNYYLSLNSKYLIHDYEFILQPNQSISELHHKYSANINIGFGWRF